MPQAPHFLDNTDLKILRALQSNGKLSNVALAELLGMSPSPCLRRVKQLEDSGVIDRYVALIDRPKAGLDLMAFVEAKVPQIAGRQIEEDFKQAVMQQPSIVACYITAGQYDFLLRVVAKGMDDYAKLAQEVLLRLPGVQDLRTSFVLEAFKDTTEMPLY